MTTARDNRPLSVDSINVTITGDPNNWGSLFHTYEEAINAPPLKFAIQGFLQEDGITFLGALVEHGKTMVMLNMVKALLEGENLFGCDQFPVLRPSERVLYLIPESSLSPFVHRLKLFGLMDHVQSGKLLFRTMSAQDWDIPLTDPRILRAAEGADVFLDTAVRFMSGDENNAADNRKFANSLFGLLRAGAKTVVGAHHSPKASRGVMTLENVLRGTGDIGAMLSTCWATKQTCPITNRLYIQNVKARDFEPCEPFEIEGRPWIDETGSFKMVAEPGMNKQLTIAKRMRAEGRTHKEIGETLGVHERTVRRWQSDGKL